jgi:hypothetical protein
MLTPTDSYAHKQAEAADLLTASNETTPARAGVV